jgi:Fusaric acid resistance protein-like
MWGGGNIAPQRKAAGAMQTSDEKPHLVKAFDWSRETPVDWTAILGSAFGMAVPILIGVAAGNLPAGLAASVGGLLVGGVGANRGWTSQLEDLVGALIPAATASIVAALIGGHGWLTDALVTVLAGAAATLVGFGRPVAAIAVRFILLLVIAVSVMENTPDRGGLLVLMAAGALWTSVVNLLLGALMRARLTAQPPAETAAPEFSVKQRFTRWRRSLTRFAGWQYSLRLMLCLAIAGALRALWPEHHLHWITLTVALLAERQIDAFPVRTTQRALGAALGVLATGLLILYPPPAWAVVIGIGILAGLRPLLRARNYLAYTAAMTPLIILILDAGEPPEAGVLIDRLVATLIAAGLVIATNLLFRKLPGIDAGTPPERA